MMKIRQIEISNLTLSLDKPVFTAYGSFSKQNLLVVTVETNDGVRGFGEVPAGGTLNYGGFSPDSVAADIAENYAKRLVDMEFNEPFELLSILDRPVSRSQEEREISSKAALDVAICDLQGRLRSQRVSELFGKSKRDELAVGHILSAESPAEMAEEAASLLRKGCTSFKVKLGGNRGKDRECVEAIRSSVGDRAVIWVDPNEQWSVGETISWCGSLGKFHVNYIEQPVPGWDFEGLAKVREAIQPVKVIADQSVYSVHDAEKIVGMQAADVITIKTMRLGISKAVKVAEICGKAEVSCKIGAGGEGAVGGAAAIHVSEIAPTLADCNELSFPRYVKMPFEGLSQGSRGEWTWRVRGEKGLGVKPSRAYKATELIKIRRNARRSREL